MGDIEKLLISVLLLALNGFFVAAEFGIMAAKRHRLEDRVAGLPAPPWPRARNCP